MKNIILGQKYFRLTVIEQVPSIHKRKRFKCICDCGVTKEFDSCNIGKTESCGCLVKELASLRQKGKPSSRFIDLTGKVFGRLTVIRRVFDKPRVTQWICKCSCGKEKTVDGHQIKRGRTLSCGCLCLEINSKRMKGNNFGLKHGLTNHPLRAIRKAMIHRCENPANRFYKNYGGRGITVCDEWKNSLQEFVEWSLLNGWHKGLSIDRIDNDGNYFPENCRWVTISENSSKKRSPEPLFRKNNVSNNPTS